MLCQIETLCPYKGIWWRSTQLKCSITPDDQAALTAEIIDLARQYGRYGYRRIGVAT